MSYFYVICPISSDPDFAAKRRVLCEIGAAHNIEPFMPLEQRPIFELEKMIADLKGARFVLADLSFERPSCYFELGIAIASRAETLLIASESTVIHQVQDLQDVIRFTSLNQYQMLISDYLCALM